MKQELIQYINQTQLAQYQNQEQNDGQKLIPYDFSEIYDFCLSEFQKLGYSTNEGSNVTQLSTIMSYLVSMLNINTSVNLAEVLLPLAKQRKMVLQGARSLGYEIQHIKSFIYELTLVFDKQGDYVLEKYEIFQGSKNEYIYLGERQIISVKQDEVKEIKIQVKEGVLKSYLNPDDKDSLRKLISFKTVNKTKIIEKYIDLPYRNVEEDGIYVFLTYYDEFGKQHVKEQWTRLKEFIIERDTTLNKEFIRLDNIEFKTPRIYFKIGGTGKELREGTIFEANVLISKGKDGVLREIPKPKGIKCDVKDYKIIQYGANEETLESIKRNAPQYFNTANRLITKNDYQAFCIRNPKIDKVTVYDGDTEIPKQAGHIWLSFVPKNDKLKFTNLNNIQWTLDEYDQYLDNFSIYDVQTNTYEQDPSIKEIVKQIKTLSIPTLEYHHINPNYLDFEFTLNLTSNEFVIQRDKENSNLFESIKKIFESFTFESTYFQSEVLNSLVHSMTSFSGVNLWQNQFLKLTKRNIDPFSYKQTPNFKFKLSFPYGMLINTYSDLTQQTLDVLPLLTDVTDRSVPEQLIVDFNTPEIDYAYNFCDYTIWYKMQKIGVYKVIYDEQQCVEIKINADFLENQEFKELQIKYKENNFTLKQNIIPRLRKVKFITDVREYNQAQKHGFLL